MLLTTPDIATLLTQPVDGMDGEETRGVDDWRNAELKSFRGASKFSQDELLDVLLLPLLDTYPLLSR